MATHIFYPFWTNNFVGFWEKSNKKPVKSLKIPRLLRVFCCCGRRGVRGAWHMPSWAMVREKKKKKKKTG
jgi:hypothetical protein